MKKRAVKRLAYRHPMVGFILSPAVLTRRAVRSYFRSVKEEVCENMSAMLSEDPVLHVAGFQGDFIVDKRSDIFKVLVIEKEYETELARLSLRYLARNRDAIDVGANVGLYSVLLAKNINQKKVLAVEPAPNALARLKRNLALNGVEDKVVVYNGVVSDRQGKTSLHIVEGREEYSSIGKMDHPAIKNSHHTAKEVESMTLDMLVEKYGIDPGFVKIDVEGAEHLVLRGARNVMERNRPVILAELIGHLLQKNGSSVSEVVSMVKEFDYRVQNALDPDIPLGSDEEEEMLCIPAESVGS